MLENLKGIFDIFWYWLISLRLQIACCSVWGLKADEAPRCSTLACRPPWKLPDRPEQSRFPRKDPQPDSGPLSWLHHGLPMGWQCVCPISTPCKSLLHSPPVQCHSAGECGPGGPLQRWGQRLSLQKVWAGHRRGWLELCASRRTSTSMDEEAEVRTDERWTFRILYLETRAVFLSILPSFQPKKAHSWRNKKFLALVLETSDKQEITHLPRSFGPKVLEAYSRLARSAVEVLPEASSQAGGLIQGVQMWAETSWPDRWACSALWEGS